MRTEGERSSERLTLRWSGDVGWDGVEDDPYLDVRDLTIAFAPGQRFEARVGRQVLTWGTGDLVFLNDLFPKDFVSFFSGRDDEYLKAPADSVRLTGYFDAGNLDIVWVPVFTPDIYLTGERFSFFSPEFGVLVAPDPPLSARSPPHTFDHGEVAVRLFRTFGGREVALYGYRGFFKGPSALTSDLNPTFAPLSSLGASLRQAAGPGVLNLELAYYDSVDDRDGTDPSVPNDQLRTLAGFEWEARRNVTVGIQYSLEWILDYAALRRSSSSPAVDPEEHRHLLTNRITYRSGLGRVTASVFTFYSPSDRDGHWRPSVTYRHDDRWSITLGANLFRGREIHTFFGQLEDASNAYLRVRFSY